MKYKLVLLQDKFLSMILVLKKKGNCVTIFITTSYLANYVSSYDINRTAIPLKVVLYYLADFYFHI